MATTFSTVDVVAHRAGNTAAAAKTAAGHVDMIELDVHVLRGRVELRHAKVLHPTTRLWERWYLLPSGSRGVPIEEVLANLPADMPLMIDFKCFSRRSARRVLSVLPVGPRIVVSTRNWWTLSVFESRPNTQFLKSCGTTWQLWWAMNRSVYGPDHGVCVHEARLVPSVLERLRGRTQLIYSWGATTRVRCRELDDGGVSGVILDDYSIFP